MLDLFVPMMKEEWRIHTTIFGNLGFALFPVMLTAFACMGSFMLPLFLEVMPAGDIALLIHTLFLLLGVMIGSFGLMGREVMNRRFGQASLLAYSSRTLPVSEREIFVTFLAKDVVYYTVLWILPAVLGFALAAPFLGISLKYPLTLLLTLPLSFLIGLSVIFFLSTVYVRSRTFAIVLSAGMAAAALITYFVSGTAFFWLFPPYSLFIAPSAGALAVSLLLIAVPSTVSVFYLKIEYPERTKRFANSLDPLIERLRAIPQPHFIAKDALDLMRSEGGLGKILFSFLLPLLLIWMLLSLLLRFIPGISPLLVFSILLGVLSSTIYNWLTEFDSLSAYAFLPVEVAAVQRSKLNSYAILHIIPVSVLLLAGAGDPGLLAYGFVVFLSVSAYVLAVTVYLTGLFPNIMLYDARTFFWYLFAISPVLLSLIFASAMYPASVLASVLLIPIAWYLLKRSGERWTAWEPDR